MKNAATVLIRCGLLLLAVLVLTHFGICQYPQKPLPLIREPEHQADTSTPPRSESLAHTVGSNKTRLRSREQKLPLVVHLVPHSHCDAAYKKTFEEYYQTEVRHILNSVLDALSQNKSRRFLWSETSFLVKWWKDPRTLPKDKQFFQQLVQAQRLELVNGGWVMHDEAITRYDSQIQQMAYGHDLLSQLFVDSLHRPNIKISTAWQIDPFGASSTTVNLANWSGMELLVTNRLPPNIKEELKANQSLEFLWKVPGASLLVHVMDNHYESPGGFNWESLEHPSTVVTKDNVQNKSDTFMSILQERAIYYRTNNVFIPMGGDFLFQNASLQFDNMDRLVAYIHLHPERYGNTTLRYSTVREYQQALLTSMATSNQTFPVVSGSHFLPYWGGFYTTLPVLKQMVRVVETVLRTCHVRVFQALRQPESANHEYFHWLTNLVKRLRSSQEVVALMQHHDALPATSYKYVLADYMIQLQSSYNDMTDILLKLLQGPQSQDSLSLSSAWTQGSIVGGGPYLSETLLVRDASSAKSIHLSKILNPQMGLMGGISLVVLNSLAQEVDSLVHVVCTRNDVAIVLEHDGSQTESVVSQATPLEHDLESANLGLFLVSFRGKVPPLGKTRYKLHVCDLTSFTDQHPAPHIASLDCAHDAKTLSQEDILQRGLVSSSLNVQFDQQTNDLAAITRLQQGSTSRTMSLTHDIVLYNVGYDAPVCPSPSVWIRTLSYTSLLLSSRAKTILFTAFTQRWNLVILCHCLVQRSVESLVPTAGHSFRRSLWN
jgi:alpha-mannosidase II